MIKKILTLTVVYLLTASMSLLAQNSTYWTKKGIDVWSNRYYPELEFSYFTNGYNAGEVGSAVMLAMCYIQEHGTVRNLSKAASVLDAYKCKSEASALAAIYYFGGEGYIKSCQNELWVCHNRVLFPKGYEYGAKQDLPKAVAAANYLYDFYKYYTVYDYVNGNKDAENLVTTEYKFRGTRIYSVINELLGYGYENGVGGLSKDLRAAARHYGSVFNYDNLYRIGIKLMNQQNSVIGKLNSNKYLFTCEMNKMMMVRHLISSCLFDGEEYAREKLGWEEIPDYVKMVVKFYDDELSRVIGTEWRSPDIFRSNSRSLSNSDKTFVYDFLDETFLLAERYQSDTTRLEWIIKSSQNENEIHEKAKIQWTKTKLDKDFGCNEQYPGITDKPWIEYLEFRKSEFYSDKGDKYEENVIRAKNTKRAEMEECGIRIMCNKFFEFLPTPSNHSVFYARARKPITSTFINELSNYQAKLKQLNYIYCEPEDTTLSYPDDVLLAMEYVKNIDGKKHVMPSVLRNFIEKFSSKSYYSDKGEMNGDEIRWITNRYYLEDILRCMFKSAYNLYPDALKWEKDITAFNAAFALKSTSSKDEVMAVKKLPVSDNMATLIKYMTAKKNIKTKEAYIANGKEKEYRAILLEAIGESE